MSAERLATDPTIARTNDWSSFRAGATVRRTRSGLVAIGGRCWDKLWNVRLVAFLIFAGCGFSLSAPAEVPIDDAPRDVPLVTWSVDTLSGKATPQNAGEWSDFIAARGLSVAVPDGLWLMQDVSDSLADSIGSVDLAPGGAPLYRQSVSGWSRQSVKTVEGSGAGFLNATTASLPDVSTTSMTLLMFYATETTPLATRAISISGSSLPPNYGILTIGPSNRMTLTVGSNSATGSIDHGSDVIPVIVKLDTRSSVQQVITNRETITPTYTPLLSSRGIFLGTGVGASPSGRWLYMAAWYGSKAEFSAVDAGALLTALGW